MIDILVPSLLRVGIKVSIWWVGICQPGLFVVVSNEGSILGPMVPHASMCALRRVNCNIPL